MTGGHRSTRLGYALAMTAATMWALNGILARFLLDDGVSAWRLSQMRSALSWLILVVVLLATANGRALLSVDRGDVPLFAFVGICGLALVHATYFLAIERLQIGVALTIQYMGPLLVLAWLRIVHGRRLRRGLWGAAALSVAGCFLVVRAYDPGALNALGVLAAAAAAVTFAIYIVGTEQAGQRYRAPTTLAYAFGFATLFWAVVQPVWTYPWHEFGTVEAIALGLGVAVVGTLLPFVLMVTAVRHIPATRAAVVATLEPVLAALLAWVVHDEVLSAPQILGGLVVVAAVIWVQTQRVAPEAEAAPTFRPDAVQAPQPAEIARR